MKQRAKRSLRKNSQRGSQEIDVPHEFDPRVLVWDDLRIFFEVAEAGSIVGAGARLGMQQATVSRYVTRLEQKLGVVLLVRTRTGVHLTEAGTSVLQNAKALQTAVADIRRKLPNHKSEIGGVVRLSVPEGVGTYWLVPRLPEYQRLHSRLTIDLTSGMQISDTMNAETDVAI